MKKILFFLGLSGIGYGIYYYFTEQLRLALNWDFKVSNFEVGAISSKGVTLNLIISVLNKSSFAVDVKDYNINLFYSGVNKATASSNNSFTVQADSWFDVPTTAFISFDSSKGILGDLGTTLLLNKPIKITIKGKMNIHLANIPKEIIFNAKDIMVSQNSADDLGISKTTNKINDLLGKVGIKI